MAAGLDPDSFWRQTPRSFVTIMEGRSLAERREMERFTFIAFQAERMARDKRPKLKTYLDDLRPKGPTSGRAVVDALRSMKKRGAVVNIKRLGARPVPQSRGQ